MPLIAMLIWFFLAFVVGVAADTRGRSAVAWGVLSLFISPVLAGLLVLALPRYS